VIDRKAYKGGIFPKLMASDMINRLSRENRTDCYNTKTLERSILIFCLLASVYFGQGVLKGFGELENQEMAKKIGVPAIEQSYTNYLCLGAKNLAGKIFPSIK